MDKDAGDPLSAALSAERPLDSDASIPESLMHDREDVGEEGSEEKLSTQGGFGQAATEQLVADEPSSIM